MRLGKGVRATAYASMREPLERVSPARPRTDKTCLRLALYWSSHGYDRVFKHTPPPPPPPKVAAGSMTLPRPNRHPSRSLPRPPQPALRCIISVGWRRDLSAPKTRGKSGGAGKMVPTLHDGCSQESNCGRGQLGHGQGANKALAIGQHAPLLSVLLAARAALSRPLISAKAAPSPRRCVFSSSYTQGVA